MNRPGKFIFNNYFSSLLLRGFPGRNPRKLRKLNVLIPLLFGLSLILVSTGACGEETEKKPQDIIPESAIVEADNLAIRTDPLPTASEIDTLPLGTRLSIKKRSREKARISRYNDYWYKVKVEGGLAGLEGWVYGARLSISQERIKASGGALPPETDSAAASLKVLEEQATALKKALIGKWWEIRSDGSSGYRKLIFWPDGKYKYGYASRGLRGGTYTLDPIKKEVKFDKSSGVGDTITMKRVGRDYRLVAEHKGDVYTFRLGHLDPDHKDEGLEKD